MAPQSVRKIAFDSISHPGLQPLHPLTFGTLRLFHVSRILLAPRAGTRAKLDTEDSLKKTCTKIELRDYQEECIASVTNAIAAGKKRLGVSLATGGGKTVVFTQLISHIQPINKQATKTLILAHRRELVHQAATHARAAYPESLVEIEMGSQHASGLADITVASMQSIISQDRLRKFNPLDYKLMLVDEAHHIVSNGYQTVLEHFGLRNTPQPDSKETTTPALVGVSATFSRFDGLRLGSAIDEIVYHRDYVTMIEEKWLSDVIFTSVISKVDLRDVRSGNNGDFLTSDLTNAVNTKEANEVTVRTWLSLASKRKTTLVFCVSVEHVFSMANEFISRGIDARVVTGNTPGQKRADTLDAFRSGKFPVLVNCGVFTEGTDIPNIDCVLLARPTRSRNLLVQMIGRGMRLFPGKTNCHVIDMVASLDTGITTVATLLGLDPSELLDEASMDEIEEKRRMKAEAQKQASARDDMLASLASTHINDDKIRRGFQDIDDKDISISFINYNSVFDLVADNRDERHIRGLSKNSWVAVDKDKYVLSGPDGTHLRIEPIDADQSPNSTATNPKTPTEIATHQVFVIRPLPEHVVSGRKNSSPWARPYRLLTANSFEDAVHGADSWGSEHFPFQFISRNMPWRRGPPTYGQLAFLNRLRNAPPLSPSTYEAQLKELRERSMSENSPRTRIAWLSPPLSEPLTVFNIDKGMASDMITKLKHGAKGRFKQVVAQKRREEKLMLKKMKVERVKSNEMVRVGPLES
ncbi:putative mitochondrial ATP-dependent helicase irc3 [Ceratocystis fimbriata CBS 114723]|uniref:Putative mitochondrial ATP-dependent helicase irc3 n=1 Tax=Ceratocystis fimbriata CBS 114723 TaxID=1035309 RepID=A0A2C5XAN2_9PEZI|nr:putative mitochondrial ATP-dependent helicase irc3 [Ceratocystis fimbriata CBS 114723]